MGWVGFRLGYQGTNGAGEAKGVKKARIVLKIGRSVENYSENGDELEGIIENCRVHLGLL